MAQPAIQTAFHAGEWAPALNARVDLAKYHAAAALLRNFFVDYRGGTSTRAGTEYIIQARNFLKEVRLIPFQASFEVSYVLEFGEGYIRFITDGGAVLETGFALSGATQANPCVIAVPGTNFVVGDTIFISGVGGMTQLNGRYFLVIAVAAPFVTLASLTGVALDSTGFTAYTSGGTASRVYTLTSPYLASELALIKFAQNVNTMVLCHPAHPPYLLSLVSATNWTLAPILFGTDIAAPTGLSAVTNAAGSINYSYIITTVGASGQESAPSAVVGSNVLNTAGVDATITVSWSAVTGAKSYNVYRTSASSAGVVPTGAAFGFISNVTGISYADIFHSGQPGTPADFSESIPVPQNPFQGSGVASVTVTNPGSGYTTVPSVTVGAAPAGGATATATAAMGAQSAVVTFSSAPMSVGQVLVHSQNVYNTTLVVTAISGGAATAVAIGNPGAFSGPGATLPGAGEHFRALTSAIGVVDVIVNFTSWGVQSVSITSAGAGYLAPPAVTFSSGAATATAVLQATGTGNPTVPIYFQQRLVLAGPVGNPQAFFMSQPGNYFNFNITDPIQADDAISGVLVSGQLNTIKAFVGVQTGLITLSDRQAWLISGSQGAAVTPIDITANSHAYNGCTDVPPIVSNYDTLYVQSKGSIVRDLAYNFYSSVFMGTDISVLSSHLFYGHTIKEWAYAEEPFKVIWAVREDGILLSLTFLKEQELVGWSHSDTTNGLFKSVCTVTEQTDSGSVDALYCVVERVVQGVTVKYIERMAERLFPFGVEDTWAVDSALATVPFFSQAQSLASGVTLTLTGTTLTASGPVFVPSTVGHVIRFYGGILSVTSFASSTQVEVSITKLPSRLIAPPGTFSTWVPVTTLTGAEHLAGQTVTGLADGEIIPPTVMPASGVFTLSAPATKVVVGLGYTAQMQTLALDLGEPTVQGKRKKISAVTVRCENTLGLALGSNFLTLVPMKDLVEGNIGTQTNRRVDGLVTGDARTVLDPTYTVPGQFCIQQAQPLPATILGVIPEVTVGDTK